jgi:hypothetical protein
MWVYDGEDWINEGSGSEKNRMPEPRRVPADEFQPELQIVEIPLPRRENIVPPIPIAIPHPISRRKK